MIDTPVKIQVRHFIPDRWNVSRLTIKGNTWYIYNFLEAVGNNIRTSFPFNAAVIACFWYFNKNVFSLITPLTLTMIMFPGFNSSRIHTWRLFVWFFFLRRSQKWILISIFLFNPLLRNVVKWPDTLLKSCSKCCKIFKVCLTILRNGEVKGQNQLHVKNNQTLGFVTVRSIKCLPSKIVG